MGNSGASCYFSYSFYQLITCVIYLLQYYNPACLHWVNAYQSGYYKKTGYLLLIVFPLQKLSFSRARELSIFTARLPIDEYMVKKNNSKNFHSKILAVNQGEQWLASARELNIFFYLLCLLLMDSLSLSLSVFDILLTFCDTGSWTEALQAWFPQGKGYVIAPDESSEFPATQTFD